MIKVLIADDHPIVRRGTKEIIEEAPDMVVADEASNGTEVLNKILTGGFDVVLLDISMPGRGGMDVLTELKGANPNLPVLILSMHPEKQFAIRALKTGASGYLTKASAPYELITAIRTVSQGEKYISSSLAKILASHLDADTEKKPHETLSNREFQVMCMISSGKSIKEIADELCLSIKSISTYRTRILEKLKVKNDVELTHYAIQNMLI
jgi:DNA-binding NarL/FixJ family response regulator